MNIRIQYIGMLAGGAPHDILWNSQNTLITGAKRSGGSYKLMGARQHRVVYRRRERRAYERY
jgi:hypothetical protein